ncbi:MAG: hypothetical protein U5L01_13880 [Rheinheimera sp.]|nr:hypothetical protein [Rheinheimera sp.]
MGADGEFVVPAYTAAVFVKPQGEAQGVGLKADATMGAPDIAPYGLTTVFVRGGMNGWGESMRLPMTVMVVYKVKLNINAGSYDFKVASGDWATVNMGAGAQGADVALDTAKH